MAIFIVWPNLWLPKLFNCYCLLCTYFSSPNVKFKQKFLSHSVSVVLSVHCNTVIRSKKKTLKLFSRLKITTGAARNCTVKNFTAFTRQQILFQEIRSRQMRLAKHVARTRKNEYMILARNPEKNRSLGKCKSRWEDNIKVGLTEFDWQTWTGFFWLKIERTGLMWRR